MSAIVKHHRVGGSGRLLLVLSCVILFADAGAARAQECPYTEEDIVADTLDPAGYFALTIGDRREYVTRSGPFLSSLRREEAVADTLIDGDRFHKLKVILYDAAHTTVITRADTTFSYMGVVEGIVLRWTPHGKAALAELFHDYNTCYDLGGESNAAVVDGGYDTTYITYDSFSPAIPWPWQPGRISDF